MRPLAMTVFYKRLAVSIVEGGLRMPGIGSYVLVPHGFLYPYFLALIFVVAGVNTAWVYVAQAGLAGASVSLLWSTRPRDWSPFAGLVFLALAGATVVSDFLLRLSFRLLSESLFLFLFGAALALGSRLILRPSPVSGGAAGLLLGLAVLSRTSIVVGAAVLLVVWIGTLLRGFPGHRVVAAAVLTGFVAGMSPLPVREYAATGRANIDLITHTDDFVQAPMGWSARADYYGRRLLFVVGFTRAVNPQFSPRPHWMAITAGVCLWAFMPWRGRRKPTAWHVSLVLFLAGYLAPVVLVSGIDNYGGRFVAMVMPVAALLAASAADDYLKYQPRSIGADSTRGIELA